MCTSRVADSTTRLLSGAVIYGLPIYMGKYQCERAVRLDSLCGSLSLFASFNEGVVQDYQPFPMVELL